MNRRNFMKSAALSVGLITAGCVSNRVGKNFFMDSKRPNVVLIMTDDQGYGDLSCHGNPVLKTPNLDILHDQSVRFTDFHVNPFCSPTRASLMVGKLSDRVNVRRTVNMRNYLPVGEITMADVFKANGYRTALFGKWHLGHNYPYRPMDRGFDEWFGIGDCGLATTSDYWGNDRFDDHYIHNGKWVPQDGFNTDIFFDWSIRFIRENRDKPFFLYLPTNVPHFPWNVKRQWIEKYRDKDLPMELDNFYASIEQVDNNIGRLRKFIDDEGLAENTIVIFLSDNGTAHPKNIYNAGMREKKTSVYEGGHRVPCFVHWPSGKLGEPRDIDKLTAHFDLLPTLAELCSLDLPNASDLDGRSLVPLLRQTQCEWDDRAWVMHSQNPYETPVKWESSVVLMQQWRLINGAELYDVAVDPAQKNNVAAEHPEIVEKLRQIYEENWKRCGLGTYRSPERPVIGSAEQKIVELGPDSWILDSKGSVWWQGYVRSGNKFKGYWPVMASRDATYRIDVRRWPMSVNAPMSGVPAEEDIQDETVVEQESLRFPKNISLPVAAVRLDVNGNIFNKTVDEKDTLVSFDVMLNAGPVDIRATMLDKNGEDISDGYYAYVQMK